MSRETIQQPESSTTLDTELVQELGEISIEATENDPAGLIHREFPGVSPRPRELHSHQMLENVSERRVSEDVGRILDLLSRMNPQFEYLKVAQDGNWRNGTKLEQGQEASAQTLDLGNIRSQNTAVQAFFRLEDGSHAFIGFKYPGSTTQTPAEFVQALTSALSANQSFTIEDALERAGDSIWAKPTAYTEREMDRATVMVVDYWTELPTDTVWRHGETVLGPDALKEQLHGTPELVANDLNPICLEVDFGAPGLWVGLPVSTYDGKTHHLDDSKLAEVLPVLRDLG